MRTLIHIGQHKTATTSIQTYLTQHREHFHERGLYIPQPANIHGLLNAYALDSDRMSAVKERVLQNKGRLYLWSLPWRLRFWISRHYKTAKQLGCDNVIWSNEGLYLLNSDREYRRLKNLFVPVSKSIVSICCFRAVDEYRKSYQSQLDQNARKGSMIKRDLGGDSWLVDYDRKRRMLSNTFDSTIEFEYDPTDNVGRFFEHIGYPADDTLDFRLNVSG